MMERDIGMASAHMMHASRYMAMAVGHNFDDPAASHWFKEASAHFDLAVQCLGYRLVPITTPAEDHAAAIAARVAEDDGGAAHARSMGIEPLPITDEPGFDGRDIVMRG